MSELRLRHRTRLKRKESAALRDALRANLPGVHLWPDDAAVETADHGPQAVILVDNRVVGLQDPEAGPFLSVRGLLTYRPEAAWVTVDMGAVRFVHNGADIMGPGVTAADEALVEGSWCWVRDEKNHQPLAVGRCLRPAAAMVRQPGKAIATVHHIGDRLWELDA